MSKRSKRQTRRETKPQVTCDEIVLHMVPVQPSATRPDGVMVRLEAVDEEDEPMPQVTTRVGRTLDIIIGEIPKEQRERVAAGVWRVDVSSSDETEDLVESIGEAVTDASEVEMHLCEDCELGEPCEIWGPSGSLNFVPRLPPPPEVDPVHIDGLVAILRESDENGLAMETLQAGMARFCALKPREVPKSALTMTPAEAAWELGILENWQTIGPDELTTVFRTAVQAAHPDHGGSDGQLHRVKEAKRVLDAMLQDRVDESEP